VKTAARIGFIGAGKVAQTLAVAFSRAGWQVSAASSRNPDNLALLLRRTPGAHGTTRPQEVVNACDLVFLTVTDDAIAPVCRSVEWRAGVSAVHCSGATDLAALAAARDAGAEVGGFHPLQMFANPEVALAGLPGCTAGIEADGELQHRLTRLAVDIGCTPFTIPPGCRPAYHASAYYVGPFLVALLREATALWRGFGIDERQALAGLLPLLHGTVAAVADGGLARGMGGCVARGDIGTLRAHLVALDERDEAAGALYRELALRTVPLGVERGTLTRERARELQRVLAPPSRLDRRRVRGNPAAAKG
jgi:predicted short-subunit dehydrogenase-like oxidoreductase (DUF2520 family)